MSSAQPPQTATAPSTGSVSLTETVKGHAHGAYTYAQRSLDRCIEPDTRRRAYERSHAFASARPLIFVRLLPPPWHHPVSLSKYCEN